jgi:hypothetical protein
MQVLGRRHHFRWAQPAAFCSPCGWQFWLFLADMSTGAGESLANAGSRRYRGVKTLNDKYGNVSGLASAKHKKAARVPPIRAATRDKHIFTSLPQVGELCAMAVSRALISINPAHGSARELHRFTANTSLDPAAAKSARRRPDWA